MNDLLKMTPLLYVDQVRIACHSGLTAWALRK